MADDFEKIKKIQSLQRRLRFQPIRFIHIFFIMILTIYATGIFIATITVRTQLSCYFDFLHYYLDKPIIVLIVTSIILISISCLGIISSSFNFYQGIMTFGVLLFGLFMFKLTMGLVFLAVSNSADKSIIEELEIQINNYNQYNQSIDYVQTNLNCCGINDFTDWNSTLGYIPGSCCNSDSACGFNDIISLNETGCYDALKILIYYYIDYLIIILGILGAFKIMTMAITFFLARSIADYHKKISHYNTTTTTTTTESIVKSPNILTKVQTNHNPLANAETLSEEKLDHTKGPQPKVLQSELIKANNIIRNPIYKEDSFSEVRNSRNKIVPISVPRLPRAHQRFPIGF